MKPDKQESRTRRTQSLRKRNKMALLALLFLAAIGYASFMVKATEYNNGINDAKRSARLAGQLFKF